MKEYNKKFSFKNFFDNSFTKIYTLIMFPTLISFIFFATSSISYNNKYVNLLKSSYHSKLISMCSEINTSLQNTIIMVDLLPENKYFSQAITSKTPSGSESNYYIKKLLSQIVSTTPLINSVFVLNRSNTTIYTNNATYSPEKYFKNDYIYSEYPYNFWNNYNDTSHMKILSPSIVTEYGKKTNILPVVFTSNTNPESIIIVNLNLSQLINNANQSRFTKNSNFLVISNYDRYVYNEDENSSFQFPDDFFNKILSTNSANFEYNIDGKKAMVLSYSPENLLLEYTYAIVIPYSDVSNHFWHITYIFLLIAFATLVLVFMATYFSTKQIYNPLKNLFYLFDTNSSQLQNSKNLFESLRISIQQMINHNSTLSNAMAKSLPLIQERYLIDFLNMNEKDAFLPQSENIPIDFTYDYFCSIIIKSKPTEKFYETYNAQEYDIIKSGIYQIIKDSFAEYFETYIIPSEANTLYVLLNFPDSIKKEQIVNILDNFQKSFSFDKDYMTFAVGMGGLYNTLEGLKKSHLEAINSTPSISNYSYLRINSETEQEKNQSYTLDTNTENILFNYLVLGKLQDTKELVNNIIKNNLEKRISNAALIQLYIQIINVTFKVLRMKKIAYDADNLGDLHIITNIIKQPIDDIHQSIINLIELICEHTTVSSKKLDITEVIAFLDNNFQKELSLDIVASTFNTTPKYLSRLFKEKLGLNFVDYLSELRINASKVLMVESNKNIQEILEEVGFNNRNTYIRAFKKLTGITPTEYRKVANRIK